jgi:U6 snRNA-associated Sm-like protein LSm2
MVRSKIDRPAASSTESHLRVLQLFYSFFKSLVGKEIIVELKNDMSVKGVLVAVDQYLNLKLSDIKVVEEDKYPHLVRLSLQYII